MAIAREFPNNMFKEMKTREELYKFLRKRCKVERIDEIIEIPESLEALNIEKFAGWFNERVELEDEIKADLISNTNLTSSDKEKYEDYLENGTPFMRIYFNSASNDEEFLDEIANSPYGDLHGLINE